MLSVLQQRVVLDTNHVVETWVEDMLISHGLPVHDPAIYIQGSVLPNPHPSRATQPNPSSRPQKLHLPTRHGKRKSHPRPLQSTDLHMDPTSSQLPPSPLKRAATQIQRGRGRRKGKSDDTEENVQGHEAPGLTHPYITRAATAAARAAAAAAFSRMEASRSPETEPSRDPATATLVLRPRRKLKFAARQPQTPTQKSQTCTETSTPAQESETGTTTSKAISTSPVKTMADLAFADKPMEEIRINTDTLSEDVREMYGKLKTLSVCNGILPTLIKDEIVMATGTTKLLQPFMFDSATAEDTRTREELLYELNVLGKVLNKSRSTTACVVPRLVPRHINGDILASKIVDYTINLEPSDEMEDMILRMLKNQPHDLRTINQTMCSYVRYLPIAVSIETKMQDGSEQEAKVQLVMWAAAQFNRLRMLSCTVLPTLPLLYVSGSLWFLYFACDRPQRVELLGRLQIGDTESLVGCYKLLAALRCLAGWTTTTFKDWLEFKVLHPNILQYSAKETTTDNTEGSTTDSSEERQGDEGA